jgi:hypothetical protein
MYKFSRRFHPEQEGDVAFTKKIEMTAAFLSLNDF